MAIHQNSKKSLLNTTFLSKDSQIENVFEYGSHSTIYLIWSKKYESLLIHYNLWNP